MASLSNVMTDAPAPPRADLLAFADLDGWAQDDHAAALAAFRISADTLTDPHWLHVVRRAAVFRGNDLAARHVFEEAFLPLCIGQPPALFTGYFEPVLNGALAPDDRFSVPLYARPPELRDGTAFFTRAEIENGALRGRGLELVWLDDPVEAYFLHIQGSGRVRLPDGRVMRLGYAGRNGHGYRSIGQELRQRGLPADQITAQSIRALLRSDAGAGLMDINPSCIFFRELDLPPEQGPLGTLARPLTALRSVAVDPLFTPLGAPVWVEKHGCAPIRSLMVAQDTGGAIKGPQRADIYFGTGDAAGDAAGTVRDAGRLVVLLPKDRALALARGTA